MHQLQAIVDAGAVAYLAPLVINQDAKLKRQVGVSMHHDWITVTKMPSVKIPNCWPAHDK
eukprot:scaffold141795_cov10-Tisochrysis_lutea.AAC.1